MAWQVAGAGLQPVAYIMEDGTVVGRDQKVLDMNLGGKFVGSIGGFGGLVGAQNSSYGIRLGGRGRADVGGADVVREPVGLGGLMGDYQYLRYVQHAGYKPEITYSN